MKILPDKFKECIMDLYDKAKEWLNSQSLSKYNTNNVILTYVATIIIILGLLVGGMVTTTYDLLNSEDQEKFTETVKVTVISAVENESNGKITYKTVLKYLDEEYIFKGSKTYYKCKGMDGMNIDWELEILIDSKGEISYELVDLDSD